MPLKPVEVAPQFRWNSTAGKAGEGRYIDSAGHFVSRANVRTAIDGTIENGAKNVRALAEQLRAGQIDPIAWRNAMMQEIRISHLANAAAAKGGVDQMSQADWGRAGQRIREQYDYVRQFADDVASGKQKLDGTLTRRAQMYAEAGRDTYEATAKAEMKKRGLTKVASIRHAQDSCPGCIEEADKGFVDIELTPDNGGLVPIGQRQCLSRCKCTYQYATDTGETTG